MCIIFIDIYHFFLLKKTSNCNAVVSRGTYINNRFVNVAQYSQAFVPCLNGTFRKMKEVIYLNPDYCERFANAFHLKQHSLLFYFYFYYSYFFCHCYYSFILICSYLNLNF